MLPTIPEYRIPFVEFNIETNEFEVDYGEQGEELNSKWNFL